MIILAQMKVSREPGLDAAVLAHEFNKLAALFIVGMVEPAAAIDDVIFLQDAETTSIGRSVGKDKDAPSVRGGMGLESFFKPVELRLVNGHLVRGVPGVAKDRGSETNEQGFFGNEAAKLGRRLAVHAQEHFQIALVRVELINALEICEFQFKWNSELETTLG